MEGSYLSATQTPGPTAKERFMNTLKKQGEAATYVLICPYLPETITRESRTHTPVIQAISDEVSGILSRAKIHTHKGDKSKLQGYTVFIVPKTNGKKGFTAKVSTEDSRVGKVLLSQLKSVTFGSLLLQFQPAQSPTKKPDTYMAHYTAHLHGFSAYATEQQLDCVPALVKEITGLEVIRAQRLPLKGTRGRCPSNALILHIDGRAPATPDAAVYEVVVDELENIRFGLSYPNYPHLFKPYQPAETGTLPATTTPSVDTANQQDTTQVAAKAVEQAEDQILKELILTELEGFSAASPVHVPEPEGQDPIDGAGHALSNLLLDVLIEPLVQSSVASSPLLSSPGFRTPLLSNHAPLLPTPSAPAAHAGPGLQQALSSRGGHGARGGHFTRPETSNFVTPYNTRSRAANGHG
jgi:hypothetical protein